MRTFFSLSLLLLGVTGLCGAEPTRKPTAAERGREALLGRAFTPPVVRERDFQHLWRVWGLREKPADFDARLRERYGLHPAPYPNHGLPMGLREARHLLVGKGVAVDCLLCHASSIAGQSVIGLGNTSLDLEALLGEMAVVQGLRSNLPFSLSNVRGTTEASASAAYLFQFRDADLNFRAPVKSRFTGEACEDVPAWWLMKKKQTLYHTGSHSVHAVRSMMSFLLNPLNGPDSIKGCESTFQDIKAYLLTLTPPVYPFPIDAKKAQVGKQLFVEHCARCHGTYGAEGKYPNKIIPLETIGTDSTLLHGFPDGEKVYNATWFAQEKGPRGEALQARSTGGYQAPPLDGIWATAPYFHNGSVPTLYQVLNSRARPRIFTRSYHTGKDDYDTVHAGWKIDLLAEAPGPQVPALTRRRVYDTTQPGRGNGGHRFGDTLTEAERFALIEYLKTL